MELHVPTHRLLANTCKMTYDKKIIVTHNIASSHWLRASDNGLNFVSKEVVRDVMKYHVCSLELLLILIGWSGSGYVQAMATLHPTLPLSSVWLTYTLLQNRAPKSWWHQQIEIGAVYRYPSQRSDSFTFVPRAFPPVMNGKAPETVLRHLASYGQ